MNTIETARGRWLHVLSALGVDERYLRNRHGPCPLCGGRDRYRWDDKDGSGSYYCNQCGPGTGLLLLQKLNGWDFKTAAGAIDGVLGRLPPRDRVHEEHHDDGDGERRLRALRRALSGAVDRSLVENYLASRGLSVVAASLQKKPGLDYYENGQRAGAYPAMLAPLIAPDGCLESVLRTYIGNVPSRKKLMPAVHTVKGASVRLFEAERHLGIAEGIETAIAAYELFSTPVWAVLGTSGVESWTPPAGVELVTIFADHDLNFAGQKAAYALANRLARNVRVEVRIPPEAGTDWADVICGAATRLPARAELPRDGKGVTVKPAQAARAEGLID